MTFFEFWIFQMKPIFRLTVDRMTLKNLSLLLWTLLLLLPAALDCNSKPDGNAVQSRRIPLPEPVRTGEMTLEETLHLRRSVRSYTAAPITLQQLSQLLWAAQGITSDEGFRTAPSAGALFPLMLYVVVGSVEGLQPGIYTYAPSGHTLTIHREGDIRHSLSLSALDQSHIEEAAVDIVIAAEYERTTDKYGQRGRRYVHMEAGHVGQNLCLQAQSLDVGVCPVGAFDDEEVKALLELPDGEEPLYIFSVGQVR